MIKSPFVPHGTFANRCDYTSPNEIRERLFHVEQDLDGYTIGWEKDYETLESWIAENAGGISEKQKGQVKEYCNFLYFSSGRMNLISGRDRNEIASKHILSSLIMGGILASVPNRVVLDLGSGGGLPGIPLKILFPESTFILVESRRRRANFLKEVIRRLDLELIEVINKRVESINSNLHGCVDIIVSRATTNIGKLMEWGCPILKPYGLVLFTLDKGRGYRMSKGMVIRLERSWGGQLNWYGGVR